MSVYTPVNRSELIEFLNNYPLGALVSHQGISAGIENTNYFVTTEKGGYVLTLFEELTAQELPYFLNLMAFLSEQGVMSAHPIANSSGSYIHTLNGKPATIVIKLNGASITQPTTEHCQQVGQALAKLHLAGQKFDGMRENKRGINWSAEVFEKLKPRLDADACELAQTEIARQQMCRNDHLPSGVIHADLFKDNVLFSDHQLTGIIDFYYACHGALSYDVAITINDWCSEESGDLNQPLASALVRGYNEIRAFTDDEKDAWQPTLCAAALRFWLSRSHDLNFQKSGEITHTKDPNVYHRILRSRQSNNNPSLNALLAGIT